MHRRGVCVCPARDDPGDVGANLPAEECGWRGGDRGDGLLEFVQSAVGAGGGGVGEERQRGEDGEESIRVVIVGLSDRRCYEGHRVHELRGAFIDGA